MIKLNTRIRLTLLELAHTKKCIECIGNTDNELKKIYAENYNFFKNQLQRLRIERENKLIKLN